MRTKVLLTVSVWICCYSILSAQTTDIRSSGESLKSESKSPLTYTTVVDLGVAELSVGKDNIHHVFLRYGDKEHMVDIILTHRQLCDPKINNSSVSERGLGFRF